jgi:hypothetical protein
MVFFFKRNIQGLDPINEKTRLLPPPPLTKLRYQGTGPSQYISYNFKVYRQGCKCVLETRQTLTVKFTITGALGQSKRGGPCQ